jgi:hypothetical protein
MRCGPAVNAVCPWQRGADLCCVQRDMGFGECVKCHEVDPVNWLHVWSKAHGGWSAVRFS